MGSEASIGEIAEYFRGSPVSLVDPAEAVTFTHSEQPLYLRETITSQIISVPGLIESYPSSRAFELLFPQVFTEGCPPYYSDSRGGTGVRLWIQEPLTPLPTMFAAFGIQPGSVNYTWDGNVGMQRPVRLNQPTIFLPWLLKLGQVLRLDGGVTQTNILSFDFCSPPDKRTEQSDRKLEKIKVGKRVDITRGRAWKEWSLRWDPTGRSRFRRCEMNIEIVGVHPLYDDLYRRLGITYSFGLGDDADFMRVERAEDFTLASPGGTAIPDQSVRYGNSHDLREVMYEMAPYSGMKIVKFLPPDIQAMEEVMRLSFPLARDAS